MPPLIIHLPLLFPLCFRYLHAVMARQRILLVKTHALGDVLLVTPALRAVRKGFPDAHITFLTGSRMLPMLEGNPHIDALLTIPEEALFGKKRLALAKALWEIRRGTFDLALVFQPARSVHGLLALGGVKQIAGFWGGGWNPFLSTKVPWVNNSDRSIADHFLDLPRAVGVDPCGQNLELMLTAEERAQGEEIARKVVGTATGGVLCVAPAGGANVRDSVPEKRWAPERFARVADVSRDRWDTIALLVGAPSEKGILMEVARAMQTPATVRSDLSLREVFAVIAASRAVLTNDSLPLHVATALKVPSVTIFGPSSSRSLHPRSGPHRAVQSEAPCSPCYANEPFPGCKVPVYICLPGLGVERVIAALEEVMGDSGGGGQLR